MWANITDLKISIYPAVVWWWKRFSIQYWSLKWDLASVSIFLNCNLLCLHTISVFLSLFLMIIFFSGKRFYFPLQWKNVHTFSASLWFVWKTDTGGGFGLSSAQTPTKTPSTGLKLVPGFGRMPLSLCLSHQELEVSESVSYDDTARVDQLDNCPCRQKNTQCLKKRSESWNLTASTDSDYMAVTEEQILHPGAHLIWTNVSWWGFSTNPSLSLLWEIKRERCWLLSYSILLKEAPHISRSHYLSLGVAADMLGLALFYFGFRLLKGAIKTFWYFTGALSSYFQRFDVWHPRPDVSNLQESLSK